MKRLFLDLETSGLEVGTHGIHQIACLIETPTGSEELNFKVQPKKGQIVSKEALDLAGLTIEQLREYPSMFEVYHQLTAKLGEYVDKFDKRDKFFLYAYNASFDTQFLRQWFVDNGDNYYGSWFWHPPIDIMTLAAHSLMASRPAMVNFKLGTVAQELGIETNENELHDGLYDVKLAKQVYERITGQTQGATA